MFSQAEENYLKAIYHLSDHGSNAVSTNAIAEKTETKASSVTDMIKRLAQKKLTDHKKYQGVHLTIKGRNMAVSIIRKHRLWETFLVNKLNFNWDEVHDVAEQLEHIKSDKLIDELDAFLGFPTHDPHGDPIPDKNGKMYMLDRVLLSSLKDKDESTLVCVKDSTDELLQYLSKRNIKIGDMVKVVSVEPFDESLHVEINSQPLVISKRVADNLYVKSL